MPKDLYWNCTRGAGASGLHMVKGWRKIGGMGSGTVPDAVMWLTIGKVPYPVSDGLPRTIQTLRNLLLRRMRQSRCQRMSDCPSCDISAPSRFPTVCVEECNGSFPPLASAFV